MTDDDSTAPPGPLVGLTDAEVARMRRDAERLEVVREAMEVEGRPEERSPWGVRSESILDGQGTFWEVVAGDGAGRADVFADPSMHAAVFVVTARNLTPEADVLALLAERGRLVGRIAELEAEVARLSGPKPDGEGGAPKRPLPQFREGEQIDITGGMESSEFVRRVRRGEF